MWRIACEQAIALRCTSEVWRLWMWVYGGESHRLSCQSIGLRLCFVASAMMGRWLMPSLPHRLTWLESLTSQSDMAWNPDFAVWPGLNLWPHRLRWLEPMTWFEPMTLQSDLVWTHDLAVWLDLNLWPRSLTWLEPLTSSDLAWTSDLAFDSSVNCYNLWFYVQCLFG